MGAGKERPPPRERGLIEKANHRACRGRHVTGFVDRDCAGSTPLRVFLAPCASERLKIWPASKRLGNVRHKGRDFLDLMSIP